MTVSLTEHTYARLREDIASGVLCAGMPLVEQQVAARLGVSRTPVRTAITRLSQEGFAEYVGSRGAVVSRMSLSDMLEIFDIREGLESTAAALAASRMADDVLARLGNRLSSLQLHRGAGEPLQEAGDELHTEILGACGNKRLVRVLDTYRAQFAQIDVTARALPSRLEQSLDEHVEIWLALRARDAERAALATRQHIRSTRKTVMSYSV
jgi:DNA-binding GntR family transcriptional regulator